MGRTSEALRLERELKNAGTESQQAPALVRVFQRLKPINVVKTSKANF